MSIFKKEVAETLGIYITEKSLDDLEQLLKEECVEIKVPYTRYYLRTVISTVDRFIKVGVERGITMSYTDMQVSWILHIEKLLERFEEKVRVQMLKQEDKL